jgi:hypothetical protein
VSGVEKMNLNYVFEKRSDGSYQVRLCGEFVCYSNHTSEDGIDQALIEMGYKSREDFLKVLFRGIQ